MKLRPSVRKKIITKLLSKKKKLLIIKTFAKITDNLFHLIAFVFCIFSR